MAMVALRPTLTVTFSHYTRALFELAVILAWFVAFARWDFLLFILMFWGHGEKPAPPSQPLIHTFDVSPAIYGS